MKKLIILIALMVPALLLAQNEETRSLGSFSEVSVSQSIKLVMVKGNENKAEISTEGELEEVITEISGGKLVVKKETKKGWSSNNDKVEIRLTYTDDLSSLKASSSASLTVEGIISGDDLEVRASSSARISFNAKTTELDIATSSSANVIAEVNVDELSIKVSSSGRISLNGESEILNATASSSGRINGDDFFSKRADLSSSSSGSIAVGVQEELKASASSSGKVVYSGAPRVKSMNTSSGGKVKSAD